MFIAQEIAKVTTLSIRFSGGIECLTRAIQRKLTQSMANRASHITMIWHDEVFMKSSLVCRIFHEITTDVTFSEAM